MSHPARTVIAPGKGNTMRTLLYTLARLLGDVNAVKRGTVGKRIGRRLAGKATGRGLGRLFR